MPTPWRFQASFARGRPGTRADRLGQGGVAFEKLGKMWKQLGNMSEIMEKTFENRARHVEKPGKTRKNCNYVHVQIMKWCEIPGNDTFMIRDVHFEIMEILRRKKNIWDSLFGALS